MWPGDPEEVSKPGSVVSIKVVRNLLEEVGKGDGHDQPCARDTTYCLILDPDPTVYKLSTQWQASS